MGGGGGLAAGLSHAGCEGVSLLAQAEGEAEGEADYSSRPCWQHQHHRQQQQHTAKQGQQWHGGAGEAELLEEVAPRMDSKVGGATPLHPTPLPSCSFLSCSCPPVQGAVCFPGSGFEGCRD